MVVVVIQFISAFEAELGPVTVVELGLGLGLGSELGTEVEVEPGAGTIWRLSGFITVVAEVAVIAVTVVGGVGADKYKAFPNVWLGGRYSAERG